MRYLLVMSVGGSLLLLFYFLTNNKKVELFSNKQQEVLLKGSLFFYLVPLFFLDSLYHGALNSLPLPQKQSVSGVVEYTYFYTSGDGTYRISTAYKWQLGFLGIWLFVALTMLCIRILLYAKKKNQILAGAEQVTEGAAYELLEKIRQEQKIKRKIRLYHVQVSAVTMGVLHPVICCNCRENPEWLELIFQHECAHIRRWDVFTRQLLSLAKSIHWFNPLIYRLPKRAEKIFELCCDEAVVKNTDKEKRSEYAKMLVMQASAIQSGVPVFHSALTEGAKEIEERIMEIMKPKTRTKLQAVLTAVILSVVFFMDSWTVLAYPDVIEIESSSSKPFFAEAEFYFVPEGEIGPFGSFEYTILYENQFVDEEGNIYPVHDEEISTAALCLFHDWVAGYQQEHVLNEDGGCTIYIYEAKRCSKCGKVKTGDLTNTHISEVCTH